MTKIASFTSDPLGYIAGNVQKACEDLARNLFGALVKVMHPDFSVSWFLEAYKVSFAVGIILFGVLLLLEIGSYRKRQIGTDEFIDNLTLYAPMYFIGVLMGPFLGNLLCRLVGAMCDGLVNWGGGDKGMAGAGGHLTKIILAGTPQGMVGGNIVSIILFLVMLVAFILIAITLLFMYVTLYLSGSVFPIGWAWIVRSQNRQTAFKVLRVFVGILASQPLVFFMLGLVMAMTKANIFGNGNTGSGMTRLMSLLGAIMALFMVAMGPWALTKFAPIGINSTEGPSLGGGKGQGRTQRGGAGSDSASDGQLGQMSRSGGSGQDAGAGIAAMGGGAAGGLAGGAAASSGGGGGSSSGGGLDTTKKGAAAGGLPGAAAGLTKDAADKINGGMNAQGDAAQEAASSQSNAQGQESGGTAGNGGALAGSASATGSDAAAGSASGSSESASADGDSSSAGLSSLAQGEQGSDPGMSVGSSSVAPSSASEQEPSGASGLADLAGQDSSGADAGDSSGITPDTSSSSSLGSHAASVPAASTLGASYAHNSQGQTKASPKQQGGVPRFSNAVSAASKVSGKAGQVAGRAKGIADAVQQQMGEQMNHQYGDRRQR
ncbi:MULTISPECIES: hypothetical protein [Dermacoccus]|uniref:TrbL/VirB6 plasmid conjugal transfer protein n=1 Tax=Dermacoccus abyssi TaxID=322596 RepID=A0A417Z179_9MICO|nr:hypothetical protein [Dermacoccus abyssi]RHW43749.1 hypothetical protein D1832_14190 [Dermacoccus abyssi]